MKLHLSFNQQGLATIGGKTLRTLVTDSNTRPGRDDLEHQTTLDFERPDLEPLVREIMLEIAEERMAGKLRPFVEGEPIGVLPRLVRKRALTDTEVCKARNRRMEDHRREMLALRKSNDEDMRRLLA